MSEEEIIDTLTNPQKYDLIEIIRKFKREGIENFVITKSETLKGLLDLYNKEKEKNKEAIDYMYDLLNSDIPNVGTADINNLLNILEE